MPRSSKLQKLIILLSPVLLLFALVYTKTASAISENVVISEIQIAGDNATDEFIELFNSSSSEMSLDGWRITKKTQSGLTESNLVASMSGTIAPNSYFLVAHPDYNGSVPQDLSYSAASNSISADNTVILYSDSGDTVIDLVGLGDATEVETASVANPDANSSVRRIDNQDTDNNSTDFELLETPDPQNSSSASPSPSPTASPTPEPTESPSPSPEPTASPEPTESPTPSPSPTESPSPSPEPTASPEPTESPVSTPTPRRLGSFFTLNGPSVCQIEYVQLRIGFFRFFFPIITCERG